MSRSADRSMATWQRLERLHAQGERSVIPCRKSVRFRYFDFDEEATVLENTMVTRPPPRESSPLPAGFWGNLPDVPPVRGSPTELPVITKPQRPRMGTAEYKRRSAAGVFTRNSFKGAEKKVILC